MDRPSLSRRFDLFGHVGLNLSRSWGRGASIAAFGLCLGACQSAQPGAPGPARHVEASLTPSEPAEKASPVAEPKRGETAPAVAVQAKPVDASAKGAADVSPASAPKSKAAAPVAKTSGKKTREHQVLLLGDSLAATGFGVLLESALDRHPQVECARRAKSSTGLARPDFFDWIKEGKRAVSRHNPELVIVLLGGNDGQDLLDAKKKSQARWPTPRWDEAYAERVLRFVDGLKDQGRKVLWLGLPRTDTKSFERKMEKIRAVTQGALAQRSADVTYVNTSPLLEDEQGRLKRNVRRGRRVAALRQRDGIHFTMHGSQYFADRVYPVVLNALGLPDVQN